MTTPTQQPAALSNLLARIDAAIERITTGLAPMRVPAESTDPDLVLADCKRALLAAQAQLQVPDGDEVERVLDYLRTDEAQIRASKRNYVWADTMARASDLIRALAVAPTVPAQAAPSDDAQDLHPRTADLVDRFAAALKEKLAAAEKKYGYSDGWADHAWMDECRAALIAHVHKGDPRDVAAYCAFLWHHGARAALEEQFIYDTLGKWPGVAAPAAPLTARMLTENEVWSCECSTYERSASAIQRKFCEVNGITLAGTAGTKKESTDGR